MTSDSTLRWSAHRQGPARLTLTVEEAASALGVGRGLAYEMVRQGRIPSLRLGRRVVVPAAALGALVGVSDPPQSETGRLSRTA